jgi:hypothetical protein
MVGMRVRFKGQNFPSMDGFLLHSKDYLVILDEDQSGNPTILTYNLTRVTSDLQITASSDQAAVPGEKAGIQAKSKTGNPG